jgi:thymidylate synthase ThyX
MWNALESTKDLSQFDAAKEYANRLLAPFDTITTILSGTDFDNFFNLRCTPEAQAEIRTLAYSMKEN